MAFDGTTHRRRSVRLRGYDYSQAGAYFITVCTQDRVCLFGDVVDGDMRLNGAGRMVQSVWDAMPTFYPGVATDEFVVMPNHIHGIVVLVGATPRGRPEAGQTPHAGQAQGPAGQAQGPAGQAQGPAGQAQGPVGQAQGPAGQARGPAPTPDGPRMFTPPVGADPRVRPGCGSGTLTALPVWADPRVRPGGPPRVRPMGQAQGPAGQAQGPAPTLALGDVVRRFKTMTTSRYANAVKQLAWPAFSGRLWQRNYYEHIIRDEESLSRIRRYILDNPVRWAMDRENPEARAGEAEDASAP